MAALRWFLFSQLAYSMNDWFVVAALALIGEKLRVEVAFWYCIYLLVLSCNRNQQIVI